MNSDTLNLFTEDALSDARRAVFVAIEDAVERRHPGLSMPRILANDVADVLMSQSRYWSQELRYYHDGNERPFYEAVHRAAWEIVIDLISADELVFTSEPVRTSDGLLVDAVRIRRDFDWRARYDSHAAEG